MCTTLCTLDTIIGKDTECRIKFCLTTRSKVGRLYRLYVVSEVDRQSAIADAVDYLVLQHLESLSTSIHKLKFEVTNTNDISILSTTFTKRFINSHTKG